MITQQQFEESAEFMEGRQQIKIDSNLSVAELEKIVSKVVADNNFYLLDNMNASQTENYSKIEGFARGLYDKQDVALSVAIKQMGESTSVVVKAMSEDGDKLTDILKDMSVKLDDIKSDTELTLTYTEQIEIVFDKLDNLENFLIAKLGNEFDAIKADYHDYKSGKITRKELIKRGIILLGKRFVKKIVATVI